MRKILAALLPIAVAVMACGGGSSPSPSRAPTTAPSVAASAPASAPASAAAGDATVMVATSELGEILVDGAGMTLYAFTDDTAGTPTCYDACADNWPALLATGEVTVGTGLDAADFSTATRTDGGDQVVVGDMPLYYFAADAAAGDTEGQGVGDKWFVVSPTGELIR